VRFDAILPLCAIAWLFALLLGWIQRTHRSTVTDCQIFGISNTPWIIAVRCVDAILLERDEVNCVDPKFESKLSMCEVSEANRNFGALFVPFSCHMLELTSSTRSISLRASEFFCKRRLFVCSIFACFLALQAIWCQVCAPRDLLIIQHVYPTCTCCVEGVNRNALPELRFSEVLFSNCFMTCKRAPGVSHVACRQLKYIHLSAITNLVKRFIISGAR